LPNLVINNDISHWSPALPTRLLMRKAKQSKAKLA
jgi:hypothetical protein